MGVVIRAGVIVVVLPLAVGSGMAAAEPVPLPDVTQTARTVDGWLVRASLTGMTINPVPNMADTFYTKEAFVSGTAITAIEGNGKVPVKSGALAFGMQVGCQTGLSLGPEFILMWVDSASWVLIPMGWQGRWPRVAR